MRRNSFLIGLLTAVLTFAALSAFVHRPYGWHRGWRHDRCYYNDRYHDHENNRMSPNAKQEPKNDSATFNNQ
jgi:hypothetical protein